MKFIPLMKCLPIVLCILAIGAFSLNAEASGNAVSLTEDASSYTLSNQYVTARISKQSGDLISLVYKEHELLSAGSGHPYGYWSHAPAKGAPHFDTITIDPTKNGGERAEVSIRGLYQDGTSNEQGPGGATACDIEIRYTLGRDDSGIYTYSTFTHKSEYPATQIGEARFAAKLNSDVFDWMTVDAARNKMMPRPEDWNKGTQLNMKEARLLNTGMYKGQVEHKYDYSAVQFDSPAVGWSSTHDHIGFWIINPSDEYLSGGPTKLELTAHLDGNEGAAPTVLNYWRGSHYGGSSVVLKNGEAWTKTIGPFLIYCNSAADPQAMWKDALRRADKESRAWPYDWVSGVDYPHNKERGTVSGKIILKDVPGAKMSNLLVGLAAHAYEVPGFRGGTIKVDWQNDAKNYEFWARADPGGKFVIPKVRPGKYTLHAIANGVLGEYAKIDITVEPGKTLDLGGLEWKPVRYGRQIWEIGIPDRTAGEFFHGDHYYQCGLYNQYVKDFPNDVNFIIGKSDYRKDWNIMQVPRAHDDTGRGRGDETTWTVTFNMPDAPTGKAALRVALAGIETRDLTIKMNDQQVAAITNLPNTSVIHRDSDRGYWQEVPVFFDASILKQGKNVLKLIVPAGGVMSGVEYDYLRLELDDTRQ